ncbi:MAG: hypothetical protein K2Q12_03770 [Rickettsiales bacterium]|nr:hypothetical protein [Rickettsiales bacterium]
MDSRQSFWGDSHLGNEDHSQIETNARSADARLRAVTEKMREQLAQQVVQLRVILNDEQKKGPLLHAEKGWEIEKAINQLHGIAVGIDGVVKKKADNQTSFRHLPPAQKHAIFDFQKKLKAFFGDDPQQLHSVKAGGVWSSLVHREPAILRNPFFSTLRAVNDRDMEAEDGDRMVRVINPLLTEVKLKSEKETIPSFLSRCDYSEFIQAVEALRQAERPLNIGAHWF